jgi:hypothetical protein
MSSNLYFRYGKQALQELLKGNFTIIKNIKYFNKWKTSLKPGMNSVTDQQPWITFAVIDFLKSNINSNSRVFEYGGGGSTLFFVNRAKEVVTVEHDTEWFTRLQQNLANESTKNWSGNLILPENKRTGDSLDASNPDHYYTSDENFLGNIFKSYASYIDRYPDEYFDIVLVDGRSRPSCIFHSLPKIKKTGYLIVDNSDRKYYFKNLNTMLQKNFKLIFNQKSSSPYADFFTQTGVWQKL